jgi:hypothetical protein
VEEEDMVVEEAEEVVEVDQVVVKEVEAVLVEAEEEDMVVEEAVEAEEVVEKEVEVEEAVEVINAMIYEISIFYNRYQKRIYTLLKFLLSLNVCHMYCIVFGCV